MCRSKKSNLKGLAIAANCRMKKKARKIMPPTLNRNRNRTITLTRRSAEVQAVERALDRINYSEYSAKVVRSVTAKAEVHDRIRARSLAGTANFVLR